MDLGWTYDHCHGSNGSRRQETGREGLWKDGLCVRCISIDLVKIPLARSVSMHLSTGVHGLLHSDGHWLGRRSFLYHGHNADVYPFGKALRCSVLDVI